MLPPVVLRLRTSWAWLLRCANFCCCCWSISLRRCSAAANLPEILSAGVAARGLVKGRVGGRGEVRWVRICVVVDYVDMLLVCRTQSAALPEEIQIPDHHPPTRPHDLQVLQRLAHVDRLVVLAELVQATTLNGLATIRGQRKLLEKFLISGGEAGEVVGCVGGGFEYGGTERGRFGAMSMAGQVRVRVMEDRMKSHEYNSHRIATPPPPATYQSWEYAPLRVSTTSKCSAAFLRRPVVCGCGCG